MKNIDVLFIDPPMKSYADNTMLYGNLYHPDDSRCKVFNPGILSIASYLAETGKEVCVVHILSENELTFKVEKAAAEFSPKIIAVSCTYMHTYLPTLELSHILRSLFPAALLVAGGHHIAGIAGIALSESEFDIIVEGEGEAVFEKMINAYDGNDDWNMIGNLYFRETLSKKIKDIDTDFFENFTITDFKSTSENYTYCDKSLFRSKHREKLIALDDMPFIRYDLYENYKEYPPYLEESRGCYGNCKYCVDSICNRYRYKSAARFLEELDYVISIYGKDNVFPFTAANFGVNVKNTIDICNGIIEKYGSLKWISEFRLDLNWEKYIDKMYESGCTSFNIGLESASPEILAIMDKTKNTEAYLEKAEKLIKKIKSFGDAYVHLNFMVYYGESPESMADNMAFISKYFKDISIVHYSPLIIYSGTKAWDDFNYYNRHYGATIVKNETYDALHAYPVNISDLYSYHEACIFSRIVEKMFVRSEGYMVNHETRVARNVDGSIDEEAKKAYIQRMLDN